MRRWFLWVGIMCLLWGCAELDHAGDVALREVRSINMDNPPPPLASQGWMTRFIYMSFDLR